MSPDSYYWQFFWAFFIEPTSQFSHVMDNVRLLNSVLAHYLNLIIGSIFFSDLFLWDMPMSQLRFLLAYNVIGLIFNFRLLMKSIVRGDKTIGTLVIVYTAATWCEREGWDGFGVYFTKNIDMRRILNDYGFFGHPFRKDFPLSGYVEQNFSLRWFAVKYELIRVAQEFRYYYRKAPWTYYMPAFTRFFNMCQVI